ncbi:hypothetical protein K461DRAFT_278131 [Myriangium duriaei CBS 260.36]|uniref:BZIP domain-containing protein n=1 Tax=Myriangium duriaei CBS 260.36 TaxID=1168546 RepID=A0A9P4J0M8_9PEZI|nr:hypothetical protein K461DRAFT_278131 [Myriangium duriaei CBS 260.36]
MEHISPQSLMTMNTHTSVSPDPMFPMDDFMCPPTGSLSVTKPVKKRKSWGQELPEPKTSLPPRKRAKTDDEKEQRRIERIKRNRAAAHNSRERKRLEAEQLATANDGLHKQLQYLRQRVAQQDAQLAKCREQLGGTLPEVDFDEAAIFKRRPSAQSSSASPAASSSTIDPRASLACSTPATSPDSTPYIKLEDNMCEPFQNEAALFDSLDPTQHSAAMLCDLQCRSSEVTSLPSLPLTLQTWFWTHTILFLMQTSIMNFYKTSLLVLWSHSPTQMNRLLATLAPGSTSTAPRPSTIRSPIPQPNWLTLARHFLAATGLTTSGSSALALSGSRVSDVSHAAWSIGRSMEKGFYSRSFERQSIGYQERDDEHDKNGHDAASKIMAERQGDTDDGGTVLP